MKKLLVILILPVLYACEIPTAVELRGNPELLLSTQMNIGKMFVEQLEKGFESSDFKLIPCVNTSNYTYIVHNDFWDGDIKNYEFLEGSEFIPDYIDIELPRDTNLLNPIDAREIPLSGLGDLLEGFIFSGSKTYLYVSGTDIVNKLWLEIAINDDEKTYEITKNEDSGYDKWSYAYFDLKAPPNGYELNIPLDGSDVSLKFRVYAKAGTKLKAEDFDNAYMRVELVIWLPLEFTATSPNGAEIAFPMNFIGEGDLFGRTDPEAESIATEIIESLSLVIKFNTNPFIGKDLIILSGENIEIREEIKTNSLNIIFDEENMALINEPENFPFAPTFKIVFDYGDTLKLSKLFSVTELIIRVRIKSIINFDDFLGKTDVPNGTLEL